MALTCGRMHWLDPVLWCGPAFRSIALRHLHAETPEAHTSGLLAQGIRKVPDPFGQDA